MPESDDDIKIATVLIMHAYHKLVTSSEQLEAMNPGVSCMLDPACYKAKKCVTKDWDAIVESSTRKTLKRTKVREVCCSMSPMVFAWTDRRTRTTWYAIRGTITYTSVVSLRDPVKVLSRVLKEPELFADMEMLIFGLWKPALVKKAVDAIVEDIKAVNPDRVAITGHSLGGSIALRAKHVLGKLIPNLDARVVAFAPFVKNVTKYVQPSVRIFFHEKDFVTNNVFISLRMRANGLHRLAASMQDHNEWHSMACIYKGITEPEPDSKTTQLSVRKKLIDMFAFGGGGGGGLASMIKAEIASLRHR